jgi:hypothetical protein
LKMRARVLQRSGRRHLQTYHDHLSHIYLRHEKEEKAMKAEFAVEENRQVKHADNTLHCYIRQSAGVGDYCSWKCSFSVQLEKKNYLFKASLFNQVTRSIEAGTTKVFILLYCKPDLVFVGRKEETEAHLPCCPIALTSTINHAPTAEKQPAPISSFIRVSVARVKTLQ